MKWIHRVQTSDGLTFDNVLQAERHADARHADALGKIAHEMVHLTKYSQIGQFIDTHLDQFVALKALKDDMALEPGATCVGFEAQS